MVIFLMSTTIYASTDDSVSYTNSYASDVYYSFKNGTIKTETRANWEIGFGTSKLSSSIIINGGSGVQLFTYPNADTAGWTTVDTVGISTWKSMRNSEEAWEEGAFSAHAGGHPDYGWGNYNSVTHNLSGDSIFIIKQINGNYKKLWIVSKQSANNIYTFRFANIDGSSDTTIILNCNPYEIKNYIYYSLENNLLLDRDPDSDSWDILFTKYAASQTQGGYYNVTGVLSNNNVLISKVDEVDTSMNNWGDYLMSDSKTAIGWDWKEFNMATFTYDVSDSLVYFVKTADEEVYKLIFTGFAGSSTGNVYFKKELLSVTSVEDASPKYRFRLYPNPAEEVIFIEYNSDYNNSSKISIYDIGGRLIFSKSGINQAERIDISSFNKGLYFIKLENASQTIVEKFIVK